MIDNKNQRNRSFTNGNVQRDKEGREEEGVKKELRCFTCIGTCMYQFHIRNVTISTANTN